MAKYLGFEPLESDYYFISYDSRDEARVAEYVSGMAKEGFPMWYDNGIPMGEKFERVLAKHIEDCRGMLLFLSHSPFSKADSYVRMEFELARSWNSGEGKKIIVVHLDKVDLDDVPDDYKFWYLQLQRIQGITAYEWNDIARCRKAVYEAFGFRPDGTMSAGNEEQQKEKQKQKVERERKEKLERQRKYASLSSRGFSFRVGGAPYTDDIEERAKMKFNGEGEAPPLKKAVERIFTNWMTDQVFLETRGGSVMIRDEFLRLLRVLYSPLDGALIEEIMRGNERDRQLNRNRKFFRLFYEVIYKGDARPNGFYWSDKPSEVPISPWFYTFEEFSERIHEDTPQGEQCRHLLANHKRELQIFFGLEEDDNIMDLTMISEAENTGKLRWFDSETESSIDFGTIEDFVNNMKRLMPANESRPMVDFLRGFCLTTDFDGRDQYALAHRKKLTNRLKEVFPHAVSGETEVFDLMNISQNAGATYAHYLTLMIEHAKMTGNTRYEFDTRYGKMHCNSTNPTESIRQAARGVYELELGDGLSDDFRAHEGKKRHGYLALLKSLLSCGVFGEIDGDAFSEYFSVPEDKKQAAVRYMMLFGKDSPAILWNDKSVGVAEYVAGKISALKFDELTEFFKNSEIASAFLERDPQLALEVSERMGELTDRYDMRYDALLRAFKTTERVDSKEFEAQWRRKEQEALDEENRRLAERITEKLTIDGGQGKVTSSDDSSDKPAEPIKTARVKDTGSDEDPRDPKASTDSPKPKPETEKACAESVSEGDAEILNQNTTTPENDGVPEEKHVLETLPIEGERRARRKRK